MAEKGVKRRYPRLRKAEANHLVTWANNLGYQLERDFETTGGRQFEIYEIGATQITLPGAGEVPDAPTSDEPGLGFDAGSNDRVFVTFTLPTGMIPGAYIRPFITYSTSNTATGSIRWVIATRWRELDQAVPAWSSNTVTGSTSGTYILHREFSATLSASVTTLYSMLDIQVTREGTTDSYGGHAYLKTIGIVYQSDRRGARWEDDR